MLTEGIGGIVIAVATAVPAITTPISVTGTGTTVAIEDSNVVDYQNHGKNNSDNWSNYVHSRSYFDMPSSFFHFACKIKRHPCRFS